MKLCERVLFLLIVFALVQNGVKAQDFLLSPRPACVVSERALLDQVREKHKIGITTILGQVFDENGQPVAGAPVIIYELWMGTKTRSNGTYSFDVPHTYLYQTMTLAAGKPNYETQRELIQFSGEEIVRNFVIIKYPLTLIGCVFIPQKPCRTSAISTTILRMKDGVLKQDDCSVPD